eukprot:283979_1
MGLIPSYSPPDNDDLYPDIQRDFRLNEEKSLRFKFVTIKSHPEMLIFKDEPKYDEDPVIAVDMVYKTMKQEKTKYRLNVVRCQGQTLGKFRHNKQCRMDIKSYELNVELPAVVQFCYNYQHHNQTYTTDSKNCRRFMMALCKYIGTEWPNSWPCEELWYTARGCTGSNDNENKKQNIEEARKLLAKLRVES